MTRSSMETIRTVTIKSSGLQLCEYDESLDDDEADRFQHIFTRPYTVLTARSNVVKTGSKSLSLLSSSELLDQEQAPLLEQLECLTQPSTTSLLSPPSTAQPTPTGSSASSESLDSLSSSSSAVNSAKSDSSGADKYKFCVCGYGYSHQGHKSSMCNNCHHWFHKPCALGLDIQTAPDTDDSYTCFVCSKDKLLIKKYEHVISLRKGNVEDENEEDDDADENDDGTITNGSSSDEESSESSDSDQETGGLKFSSLEQISNTFKNLTKPRRASKVSVSSISSSKSGESISDASSSHRCLKDVDSNKKRARDDNRLILDATTKLDQLKKSFKLKNRAKQTMMLPENSLSHMSRSLKKIKHSSVPHSPLIEKTKNSLDKYFSVNHNQSHPEPTSRITASTSYQRSTSSTIVTHKDRVTQATQLVYDKLFTRVQIEISDNMELQKESATSAENLRAVAKQLVEKLYQKLEKPEHRLNLIRSALNNKNNTTFWHQLIFGKIDLDEMATMPYEQITRDDQMREKEKKERAKEMEQLTAAVNEERREWGKFLKQTNQADRIDPKDLEELKNTTPSTRVIETDSEQVLNDSDLPMLDMDSPSSPGLPKSVSINGIESLAVSGAAASNQAISDVDIEINLDKLPPKRISLAEYTQKNPTVIANSISANIAPTSAITTQQSIYHIMVTTIDDEFMDRKTYMRFSVCSDLQEIAAIDQDLVNTLNKKILEQSGLENMSNLVEARLNRANGFKHLWTEMVQRVQDSGRRCIYLLFDRPADNSTSQMSKHQTPQGVVDANDREMYSWLFKMLRDSADKERKFWYYRITEDTQTDEGVRLFFVHLRKVDDDPAKKEKSMDKYHLKLKRDRDYILGIVVPQMKKQSKVVTLNKVRDIVDKSTKRKQGDREAGNTDEETDCVVKKDKKPRIVAEGGRPVTPTLSVPITPPRDPRIKAAENKKSLSIQVTTNQNNSQSVKKVSETAKDSNISPENNHKASNSSCSTTQPPNIAPTLTLTPRQIFGTAPVANSQTRSENSVPKIVSTVPKIVTTASTSSNGPSDSSNSAKSLFQPKSVPEQPAKVPSPAKKHAPESKSTEPASKACSSSSSDLLIPAENHSKAISAKADEKTTHNQSSVNNGVQASSSLQRIVETNLNALLSDIKNNSPIDSSTSENLTIETTNNATQDATEEFSEDFHKINKILNDFSTMKFEEASSMFHQLIDKEKIMPHKLNNREYRALYEKHSKFMAGYLNSLFANRMACDSESHSSTTSAAAVESSNRRSSSSISPVLTKNKQNAANSPASKIKKRHFELPEEVRSVWKGEDVQAFAHQRRLLDQAATDTILAGKLSLMSDVYDLDDEFFDTTSKHVSSELKRYTN